MAGNIAFHPAPGLGDLLPGWYAVPQDPITAAAKGVTYTPGIGDILPAAFVVPQNPVKDFVAGQVKLIGQGQGSGKGNVHKDCGCGCGGAGTCAGAGAGSGAGTGMGDISTDLSNMMTDLTGGNFSQFFTDFGALLQEPTVLGIPLWVAGIAAYFFVQALTSHEFAVSRRGHR